MALKGDLASVDLAQVFQMLALNQKVGLLSIQAPRTWRALYFDPRGVTLYYNEHTLIDRVFATMERTGRLSAEHVKEAREHAVKQGGGVVDSLLAGGFLNQEDLEECMRSEMEEEVYDLFFWKDARFEFFEGAASFEGRDGVVNDNFFFSTDSLIMEAARRIDEWSFIQERIKSPLEVFRAVPQRGSAVEAGDSAQALLELADGKRNVARLIEVSGLPPFHVHKGLAQLLDQGMVEEVPADELVATAQECVAEGRLHDAINLFERAISIQVGLPEAHEHAAQAYEAAQEYELAAYHLKCVAEFRVGQNGVKSAVQLLRKVIELLPTDLAARERLVELTVGHAELRTAEFDPVAEGKTLVDLYLEIGEIERVRGILERLLRDNPKDLELKKSLVNVHTKAGDTKRVIELYESIAQDLVEQHNPIEAVRYLQKILLIDRNRKDVNDRIRSLYELDERRRSRRRSLVALGTLFCITAVLAGVWYFYEQHAREHFDRIDTRRELAAKDFGGAMGKFEKFVKDYPLTMVSREAQAEITRIDSQRLAHEAALEAERKAVLEKLKKVRMNYQHDWQRYQNEFRAANLDGALEALESAKKRVAEAGEDEDQRWANVVQLEKSLRELRNFLSEAVALERSARERTDKGDWRGARRFLIELTSKYDITSVAKAARLPVEIVSRPKGALIVRKGEPMRAADGKSLLRTPAIVPCRSDNLEKLELRLDGFEPLELAVDARKEERIDRVLTVVPERTITFESPAQTAAGVGGDRVAVGLRGGSLAIASLETGTQLALVKLPGLAEVLGAPQVSGDRIVYRTNEGDIACRSLADGLQRWRVQLSYQPVHEPVVRDGRVFFGDDQGRLMCLDMHTGQTLWFVPIGGLPAGRPSVLQRHVHVATQSGDLVLIDANDGAVLSRQKFAAGFSTSVVLCEGGAALGTTDGNLMMLSQQAGKVLWTMSLGRSIREDEVALADGCLLVVGPEDTLLRIDLRNGQQTAHHKLKGRRTTGPLVVGQTAYFVIREDLGKGKSRDCLCAIDTQTMETVWEYRDGGTFLGEPTTDGSAVFLTTANGRLLRFK